MSSHQPKTFKASPKEEKAFLLPCVVLKSHHACLYHLQLKFCRKTHLDVCWAWVQSLVQGRCLFPKPKVIHKWNQHPISRTLAELFLFLFWTIYIHTYIIKTISNGNYTYGVYRLKTHLSINFVRIFVCLSKNVKQR